jgi:adenosylhomocysteinase
MEHKIKDITLAAQGAKKIEWAERHMPVLTSLRDEYSKTKPLEGIKIAGCLHVTKETAVLVRVLKAAGAEMAWCGCNPLSTQDDVAAALVEEGIPVFAWRANHDDYYWCIEQVLKIKPQITLDDGADLVFTVHQKMPELIKGIMGGTEETTTGVVRIRAMEDDGKLKYPIIASNDAITKCDFDNIYGTGQSTFDGIFRSSTLLIAGKTVVVAGYGHVGVGIARRAKGLGGDVIITEIDPIKALRARMDGFRVMSMDDAAPIGDLFITATGNKHIIALHHIRKMKDGAILANSGHFNVEIDVDGLEKAAKSKEEVRPNNMRYELDGKDVFVLGEGRLVNLAAAEGHSPEVMDMSFANQLLAVLRVVKEHKKMEPKVYSVTREQDERIARIKLKSMGIKIDELTEDQKEYMSSWDEGT